MRAMSKCTVGTIFDAVSPGVSLVDTCACLVVAKMVAPLSVSSCPMEVRTSMCVCVCVCVHVSVCECVCMR